ncbi:MAG: hypothetical protein IJ306_02005 [Oscillospiraceae bacterium]|nr:hypothetical protein [Oscillospiraceae bacterium]
MLVFIPLLSYVRYEEDYFETLSFPFIKEKYFYRDVTEYEFVKNATRQGPDLDELILYFGEKKVNVLIGVNTGELFEHISNEYRKNHNGKELPEKKEKEENIIENTPDTTEESSVLRHAEEDEDYSTILEAEKFGYRILYRKKKQNHELVVNNYVYVEYIALGEPHKLCAGIDGHNIAAGHNGKIYFISFDDEIIEQKTTGFGFLFT